MLKLREAGRSMGGRFLPALQYPDYRRLWMATICSQSSAWALIVARMALVLHLTGSPAWTGAVTFAAMIPSVFVSPFAGFLADRFDRRTVLAYAYSVNLVHNLLLAILVAFFSGFHRTVAPGVARDPQRLRPGNPDALYSSAPWPTRCPNTVS